MDSNTKNKIQRLIDYLEYWVRYHVQTSPQELPAVIADAKQWLASKSMVEPKRISKEEIHKQKLLEEKYEEIFSKIWAEGNNHTMFNMCCTGINSRMFRIQISISRAESRQ